MALTDGLPLDPYGGDGYDWIENVKPPWYVVAGDDDGSDLGEWPYIIVAVRRPWCLAVYVEGDVTVREFDTAAEFDAALLEYR